jgi:hypothetical protein
MDAWYAAFKIMDGKYYCRLSTASGSGETPPDLPPLARAAGLN